MDHQSAIRHPQSAIAPRILLLDDDTDFLDITRHWLEAAGYRVLCCAAPEAALQNLAQSPCDLMITDLMMSSMDAGFALVRSVKADPRLQHLPIILATSAASTFGYDFRPRTAEDLHQMQVDAFLAKPVDRQTLLKTIEDLLKPKL